jgi:hypothetical protein
MLVPDCDIKITNTKGEIISFNYCRQIDIERSFKTLTNTCKITLPRKLKLKDRSLTDVFQRGSKIEVWLSYLGYESKLEFVGFIAHVDLTIPVVLHCEDNMWLLKQVQVNRSWEQVSLNKVLHDIIPSTIKYSSMDVQLGDFRITDMSVAKVLDVLSKQYGLYSYFRNDELCVGFAYPPKWAGDSNYEATYDMHINVADDDLEYRKADEVELQVEVESIMPNGKRLTYRLGDLKGEKHKVTFYNIPKEGLRSVAEKALEKMRVTTMKGNITSFGIPYADHGYVANIIDDEYPERSGKYFIDKVTIRFGVDGFRRILELGKTAAA